MDLTNLSEKLGIDNEKLQSVVSESGLTILSSEDKEVFAKNTEKIGYDKGKAAERGMTFKNLKKSYEGNDNLTAKAFENANGIEDVLVNINNLHSESVKASITEAMQKVDGDVSKNNGIWQEKYTSLEQTYANEKKALQEQNVLLQGEKEKLTSDFENKFTAMKTDYLLQNEFSGLNFEVPADVEAKGNDEISSYNKVRRQNTMLLFKQRYDTQFNEEGKPVFVDRSTGEKVVNELQNPVQLPDLMKKFVSENYLNVVPNRNGGRGGEDKYKTNSGLKGITDMAKFQNYAKSKGVERNSTEYITLFREVQEANPNANF